MKDYLILLVFVLSTVLVIGCFKNNGGNKSITIEGKFRSVKGVMDPLSCYCYNAGYLTTESGEKIDICIEDDDKNIVCENIVVTGYYTTKKNAPEDASPCPAGERKVFIMKSYKCK